MQTLTPLGASPAHILGRNPGPFFCKFRGFRVFFWRPFNELAGVSSMFFCRALLG